MNKAAIIKKLSKSVVAWTILSLIFLIAATAALYGFEAQKRYVKKACSDYASSEYKAVIADFNSGNKSLDGGKKDGVPCNALYEKTHK